MSTYNIDPPLQLFGGAINETSVAVLCCYGDSQNTGTANIATFCEQSVNSGTINLALFQDQSTNDEQGTILSVGTFIDQTLNEGNITTAVLMFSSDAENNGSVESATFLGDSTNSGITNEGIFADSSSNTGSVSSAKYVSIDATNHGEIDDAQILAGMNLGGNVGTETTFVQQSGSFSYGYYRYGKGNGDYNEEPNILRKNGPDIGTRELAAFECQDKSGLWVNYDWLGNPTPANRWLWVNGDQNNTRFFVNGTMLDVAYLYINSIEYATPYYYSYGEQEWGNVRENGLLEDPWIGTRLYLDYNLTTPIPGTYSGREEIVTKFSDLTVEDVWWEVKDGGLFFTKADRSVVLGGNKYVFSPDEGPWYNKQVSLYKIVQSGYQLATADLGGFVEQQGWDTYVYEWEIYPDGTATRTLLSSIELTNGAIDTVEVVYYHTGVTFETGSRVYDVTGKLVASLQGVVSDYNFITNTPSLTRHSITNGVAIVNPLEPGPDNIISGDTENYYHSIGNFVTGVTLYNTNGSIAANKSGTHSGLAWSSNASGIVTVNS